MSNLLPETVDVLLNNLGYAITSESVSMAVDQCPTSDIQAHGLDNAELDKDRIIEYLSNNGMQITKLDIHCSMNHVTQQVIGQMQPVLISVDHDISLDITCYTDTVPDDVKTLSTYIKPEIPEPEPVTNSFDLGGAL